jgi:hypothetical protein
VSPLYKEVVVRVTLLLGVVVPLCKGRVVVSCNNTSHLLYLEWLHEPPFHLVDRLTKLLAWRGGSTYLYSYRQLISFE